MYPSEKVCILDFIGVPELYNFTAKDTIFGAPIECRVCGTQEELLNPTNVNLDEIIIILAEENIKDHLTLIDKIKEVYPGNTLVIIGPKAERNEMLILRERDIRISAMENNSTPQKLLQTIKMVSLTRVD